MKIIIAGAGEVGSHLAKMLSNESNDITVIDSEPARLEALSANTRPPFATFQNCRYPLIFRRDFLFFRSPPFRRAFYLPFFGEGV